VPRERVPARYVTVPSGDDLLRRRHDLLLEFVRSLAPTYGPELPSDLRAELLQLAVRLDELTPGDRDVDTDRRVRVVATLAWEPDGGVVRLRLDGHAPGDDGLPPAELDLGGPTAELDWAAANRLVEAVRTARDGAFGTPA
jgi:hypothetical protein